SFQWWMHLFSGIRSRHLLGDPCLYFLACFLGQTDKLHARHFLCITSPGDPLACFDQSPQLRVSKTNLCQRIVDQIGERRHGESAWADIAESCHDCTLLILSKKTRPLPPVSCVAACRNKSLD